jgi:myo-inositol-1(or 4)-monophosphatase
VAIRTSGITDARQATLEIGWTPRRSHAEYIAVERRAFDQGMLVHRCGSAALGVAFVADGRIDAFAELHANSWDIAAGDIIAREAGAFASDFFTLGSMTSGNSYLCCTEPLAKVCSSFAGFG